MAIYTIDLTELPSLSARLIVSTEELIQRLYVGFVQELQRRKKSRKQFYEVCALAHDVTHAVLSGPSCSSNYMHA